MTIWTQLTPFRVQAMRLGFEFLKRECSSADGLLARINVFVHPRGMWLDLRASLDRSMNLGPVVATFSSWAIDSGELIDVETVIATPAPDRSFVQRMIGLVERLLGASDDVCPLHSAADLATAFAHHEHVLHERGLTPLIATDDPLEERRHWERTRRESVWIVAPP